MVLKSLKSAGLVLAGTAILMGTVSFAAIAQEVKQSDIDALKAQIKALERKLNNVQVVQNKEIKEVKAKQDAVGLTFENGRPIIKSGDGNNELALRGRMHFDMATYKQDDDFGSSLTPGRDLNEGGNFRRSEIGMEGKFMRDWEYLVSYDFGGSGNEGGGSIKNMFIGYTGVKPLRFQIGAIQVPFTMDDSTTSNEITFIERASPVAIATSVGAQKGRTAVGVRGATSNIFGSLYYTKDPVTLGASTALNAATLDESNNLVGRAAYLIAPNPDTNIHLGASGTRTFHFSEAASVVPGGGLQGAPTFQLRDRPELRVDGTRLIDTGLMAVEDAYVVGPEIGANWKNFYVQGEYYRYHIDRPDTNAAVPVDLPSFDFDGWYVQGSWILTGETKRYDIKTASFGAPRPKGPFGFGDSLGAFELAARYSTVDLNDGDASATCAGATTTTLTPALTSSCVRGGEQDIITIGLNWYPNRNIRFMFNYLMVDVDRQAFPNTAAGVTGGPNADVGQELDTFALRTQYSF